MTQLFLIDGKTMDIGMAKVWNASKADTRTAGPETVARATENPAPEEKTETELHALHAEYLVRFGKKVPNFKLNDIEWIRGRLNQ